MNTHWPTILKFQFNYYNTSTGRNNDISFCGVLKVRFDYNLCRHP